MSVEREQAEWLRSTTINCVSSNTQREIEEQIEVKNKQVPSQSASADCKRKQLSLGSRARNRKEKKTGIKPDSWQKQEWDYVMVHKL